jgi:hypothetical protein
MKGVNRPLYGKVCRHSPTGELMRIHVFIAGLLLVVAVGTSGPLFACGDKFLVLGRGTRYERSPAARQAAAILMYANPASELSRMLSALSVEAGLRKEGYRPIIVGSTAEFDTALRERKWDVIVVDVKESQTVSQRIQNAGGPHVVPVLIKPTKDELNQAKKLYHTVVNTPTRSRVFIDTIDDAMDLHEDEVKAAAKKGTR